jgi:hypothetical protein
MARFPAAGEISLAPCGGIVVPAIFRDFNDRGRPCALYYG